MRFKPILKGNQILAFSYRGENFDFIFGTRHLNFQNLREFYPLVGFHKLKQVHGNHFLEVKKENFFSLGSVSCDPFDLKEKNLVSSDAHWTDCNHVFLSIQTADCIPILVSNQDRVASIHAGWRSIVKGILLHVLEEVFTQSMKSEIKVALGPHIQHQSFEVKKDVRDEIARYYKKYFPLKRNLKPIFFPHRDLNKCFVSLKNLCFTELLYFGLNVENIFVSDENTFSSSHYFSYRRDGRKKGFQISGVLKREKREREDQEIERKRRESKRNLG